MKLFLAGHRGMVGSAILRKLAARGIPAITRPRTALDLRDQAAVRRFMRHQRPDTVVLAAARVGGIAANARAPAAFLYENLMIEANIIHEAARAGVPRLLFLGSSCIYPRLAPQPIPEEALLAGPLEPSNAPYAIAKIAGIGLCDSYTRQYGVDYRALMPTNLYGPGDNFHPENGHVLPALLARFHDAAETGAAQVSVWGSGNPRREFLHVDDLADAVLHVLALPRETFRAATGPGRVHINVGSGDELSIRSLADLVAEVTGFTGRILYDPSKPDGTPRKRLDLRDLHRLGWRARVPLRDGIAQTYTWFLAQDARSVRMA